MPTPELRKFFAKILGSAVGAVEAMLQEMGPFLRPIIRMRFLEGRLRHAVDTTDIFQSLLNAKLDRGADAFRMRLRRSDAAALTQLRNKGEGRVFPDTHRLPGVSRHLFPDAHRLAVQGVSKHLFPDTHRLPTVS
jgi:hypothetical protein